jgi:hypothetical protein
MARPSPIAPQHLWVDTMRKMLLVGIAGLMILSKAAHATEDFCAVVLKTPDGFLALREKPGRESKIIAKLREGDFLYAGTEQCSQSVCDTEDRKWTHINGVPRIDGPNDPKKTYNDYTHTDGSQENISKTFFAQRIRSWKLKCLKSRIKTHPPKPPKLSPARAGFPKLRQWL